MKKILVFIVILLAAFSIYWFLLRTQSSDRPEEEKQQPIQLNKHSDSFNLRVNSIMDAYLGMKDAFVIADTSNIKKHATNFISQLDSLPLAELQNDSALILEAVNSAISDLQSNTTSLLQQSDILEMRRDFSTISDLMYPGFIKMINYEGKTMYVQNCPMAFDDEISANWLSDQAEVVNPYLGKNHPKYKATMLHCGELKDSISRNSN